MWRIFPPKGPSCRRMVPPYRSAKNQCGPHLFFPLSPLPRCRLFIKFGSRLEVVNRSDYLLEIQVGEGLSFRLPAVVSADQNDPDFFPREGLALRISERFYDLSSSPHFRAISSDLSIPSLSALIRIRTSPAASRYPTSWTSHHLRVFFERDLRIGSRLNDSLL